MPQIRLEYSSNITQEIDSKEIFSKIHQVLQDVGGISVQNCKSRAIRRNDYYIAKGEREHAFIHLEIRFIEGRSPALKASIGEHILQFFEIYLAESIALLKLQITVEIIDIQKRNYYKFPKGML